MITFDDIYDIKKNGALVLGRNRLDDYATKFLSKYFKEALLKPMPISVDEILNKMKLNVVERTLSKNLDVFGCCVMFDCDIEVFENDISLYEHFANGTIIIDPKSEALYGEGQKRNTLIHEIIHWEKDKKYFEILNLNKKLHDSELCPMMCRLSRTYFQPSEKSRTKENEINWLEWQANRLAPRILMPKEMFKKKAEELINDESINNCNILIEKLSDFFIASKSSVKYRLVEVGLEEKISNYEDYCSIYNDNKAKEYSKLSVVEAYEMIENNIFLRYWIKSCRFIFVEGYFIVASEDYIKNDKGTLKLTSKAKRNLNKCAINIRKIEYSDFYKDETDNGVLYRDEGSLNYLYTFTPEYQSLIVKEPEVNYQSVSDKIFEKDNSEEKELTKILSDPDKTLCDGITFLMQNRKWETPTKFNDETLLNYDYYSRIKRNDMNNMKTDTLMAICVGMKLGLHIIQKLFDKSDNKLNYFEDPCKTYITILERIPEIDIDSFNSILECRNLQPLGSKMRD